MKYQKAIISINTSKNRNFSFQIDYPSKWSVTEKQGEETLITFLSPPKNEDFSLRELLYVIIIKDLEPSPELLQSYSMRVLSNLKGEKSPTEVNIPLSNAILFDIPAREYCYEYNEENQELLTYNRWTIIDLTVIMLS